LVPKADSVTACESEGAAVWAGIKVAL